MCENIKNIVLFIHLTSFYWTLELIVVIVLELLILSLFTPLELFNTGKCAGNLITSSYDGGGVTAFELILWFLPDGVTTS